MRSCRVVAVVAVILLGNLVSTAAGESTLPPGKDASEDGPSTVKQGSTGVSLDASSNVVRPQVDIGAQKESKSESKSKSEKKTENDIGSSRSNSQKWRSILDVVTVHWNGKKKSEKTSETTAPLIDKYSGLPMEVRGPPRPPLPSVHVEKTDRRANSNVAQHPPPVGMPTGVRAASLAERLSSGIEGMGARFFGALINVSRLRKPTPIIRSLNETMIVVHVPAPSGLGKIPKDGNNTANAVVSRVQLADGTLRIHMKSRRPPPKSDGSSAQAPSVSIDAVHVLNLEANAVTDTANVRTERLSDWEYAVYIPIRNLSSRLTKPRPSFESAPKESANRHEGHLEEDDYEFLRAHLSCKNEIGAPGLPTSLCTCERRHKGNEEYHTACVGRVVDRSFRTAKKIGDEKLAKKIYKAAISCRPKRDGAAASIKARECLLNALDKYVTGKSPTLDPNSRSSARKLLNALATDQADEEETRIELGSFAARQNDGDSKSGWSLVAARVIALVAYGCGLAVLLFGLSDIARHYRRHQSTSQRREHFTQLPDTARALYSRLFS